MNRRSREAVAVTAAAITFGLAFSCLLLAHFGGVADLHDWDLEFQLHWVPVFSIIRFHQFPYWNPYRCGGIAMFANPESRILTPFFPLHLWLGPIIGLHLEIPLHLAIGWSGAFVLARVQGLRALPSAVAGSVFAGSSWFYLHLAVAHYPMAPAVYLPWIVAALLYGAQSGTLLPTAAAGALVALTLFEGGAYPVPLDGIVGALVLGCIAIRRRSYFPILALMSFALFAAGFAAIKLVPTFALMRTHPRPWESADANTVAMMLRFLFARDQGIYPEGTWGIEGSWEYGAYIGVIAAALAIVGVARSPRRALPWVVVCVFCFAVAMGRAGLEFPWIWLHRLPLMSAERVPSRFLIGVVLGVAILAASGAELVQQGFGRFGPRVVLLLLVAMLVDFWSVSAPTLIHAVDGKLEVVPPSPEFRQIFQLAPDRTYPLALANYGSAVCFNIQEFPTAVVGYNVGRGYPGEQYLKTPGSLTRLKWSPNELSYEVDVAIPSAVIVNQNYDSGWRVVEGRGRVYRSGNLLAIEVPAGRQRLTIRNRDPYLPIGAAVSALTLLMALWLMRLERRRHRVAQPSVAV